MDRIRELVESGEHEQARREIARALREDSQNIYAWELLASLVDEAGKRADCYRQILCIDSTNQYAIEGLKALCDRFSTAASLDQSADNSSRVLNCSNCGAKMDIRFVGRLSDKRAFCPYCGSEVDLPDSFRRVEWKREKEQNARSATATEFVLIETRRDSAEGISDDLPPRLDEIHSLLSEPGQTDFEQVFKRLKEQGFELETSSNRSSAIIIEDQGCLAKLLPFLGLKTSGSTPYKK